MNKMNAAHLDNFVTVTTKDQFAVVDVTFDNVLGIQFFKFSTGKTELEAKTKFYERFMHRSVDREMMIAAQKNNRLKLQKITSSTRELIEDNLTLIAA